MTLPRPDANLTVDGQAFSAAESGLSELQVELGLNGALDTATLVLSSLSPVVAVAPGAAIEIGLVVGGDETPVLVGSVVDSRRTPWGAVVVAQTEAAVLARAHLGRAYLAQTAAEIATDLVTSGGARTGTIEAPLDLPSYSVSERRTVWRALQDLAQLSGSVLRSQADGTVDFAPPRAGPADHSLRAGAELLTWVVGSVDPAGAVPAVVPSGAGSEAGSSRWQFLLAEPDSGSPDGPTLVPMPVRTRDAAQSVHDRLAAAGARRRGAAAVTVVGGQAVRAGDLVDLEDLPGGEGARLAAQAAGAAGLAGDGGSAFHVLEAHHVLDGWGLRSRLRLEAAA